MAERWRRLLPGLWAGLLLCIAAIAAPAAFGALPSAEERGRWYRASSFAKAWLSLALAALLLGLERRRPAQTGPGNVSVLWTAAGCTLLGYFAVQALMPAARVGKGVLSFGQLHLISMVFYGIKTLAVLLLAWRAAGLSRPPSS